VHVLPTEILIAEDDRQLAASLVRALEKLGYACRQVHDGAAALEAVGQARPDGILLDLLLPKKDGHSVLQTLQLGDATREIPVIAMSGVFRGRDQQAALQKAGAKAFLEKPFSVKDLQATLHRLVGRPEVEEVFESDGEQIDLALEAAPSVIWKAMAERFTGALHFKHRKRHKVLVLAEGMPNSVRSNLAREALGRRLFDAGRIDERTFKESLRATKLGKKQGAALIDMGALTEAHLREALVKQAEDKLLEMFSWTAGSAWRQDGVREVSLSSGLGGWTPQKVMLWGVLRAESEILRRALEPYLSCQIERGPAELESKLDFAGEHALLDALDGAEVVGDLIDEHLPALFALWKMGVVEIEGTVSQVMLAPAGPSAASIVTDLRARLEEQETQDHFEVLGISRNASAAEVRKAFLDQAKSCHPDKFVSAEGEIRELASRVFTRLSEANEVLGDAEHRQRYVDALASGGSKSADRAKVARIMTAEQQFQKAEVEARRKDWDGATEALAHALELDPEEGEFHALLGWVTFMRSPDDEEAKSQALDSLKKAISLAPQSPNGYFYLGRLHRICERIPEAEKMFRKVLELRPKHVEAQQELRLIARRLNSAGKLGRKRNG
jgi:DNA-binding response OmpR family regulator/tetratricopeptide (TPR) repeat protein